MRSESCAARRWSSGGRAIPYIEARFGQLHADALGGDVQLETFEDAGHWPWLDRPDVIDRIAEFLQAAG